MSGLFGLDIDIAIGTALAAMCFVTIFGSISHYREGHVAARAGFLVGLSGVAGAVIGAELSQGVPDRLLKVGAGLMLWTLAALVWYRTRVMRSGTENQLARGTRLSSRREIGTAVGLGSTGGLSAGFFGVGMAPFLQLGFLTGLKLNLVQTVGTTMLTLVFISGSAALVLARHGDVSGKHLAAAVIGLSGGSYLGAKLTSRLPFALLRSTVVIVPIIAGAMVLFL